MLCGGNLFIAFSEGIVVDLYTRCRLCQHRATLLIAFGELWLFTTVCPILAEGHKQESPASPKARLG